MNARLADMLDSTPQKDIETYLSNRKAKVANAKQLNAGDIVTVHNFTLGGNPIIEGKAKLIKLRRKLPEAQLRELWDVRFIGETEIVTRVIRTDFEEKGEGKEAHA